jgi:hypothetical protein
MPRPLGVAAALLLLAFAGCTKDEMTVEPPPAGGACGYHDQCQAGDVCAEGTCQPTRTCLERSDCAQHPLCTGFKCICDEGSHLCLPICENDNGCPADGHCVDGVCRRYPVAFNGTEPGGGARGALKVGIARAPLDFPVGVSMAGYAMRRGPQTPWRFSLGGSNAWFDKPDVRAIAFDDGAEMFVLLRIPICWSDDFLIAETARKVQDRTGRNLIDHIVTSAPHSHSHPARFWHMVVDKYFGLFGYDEFQYEIFDRLTDSFAEAVIMAVDDLQPARFGHEVIEDFDPQNRIHRDRRGHNNNIPGYMDKDHRMIILRIDDMAGNPRAVLTNFGMHGTVFDYDNPILSGDAGGGVEVTLTQRAEEKYGRQVLGVYLQGNAGDVSPGGDDLRHPELERIQLLGERTWDVVEPVFDRIQTSADVRVSIASSRLLLGHDVLYGPGEFFDHKAECTDTPSYFRFGAFQCVEGMEDDEDPETRYLDGDLDCVFAVECLTSGYGIPQFQKTRLSAVRLGGLVFVTMPGEPGSQFGRDLSARVLEAMPGTQTASVLGYSQDHHFYLLHEEDWVQGGYEPSRSIWGWKLAPHLADKSVELARELAKEPGARVFDEGNLKPMYWDVPMDRKARVPPTETEGAPEQIVADVPGRVRRLEVVKMQWSGGHPGVDQPRITLMRVGNDGARQPVARAGGAPYEDGRFEMLVTYLGECGRRNCSKHKWQVAWEDGREFPLGRHALRVEGRALKGGQVVSYTADSSPFELVATDALDVYGLAISGGRIAGQVVDPPAIELVPNAGGFDAAPNGHRMRSRFTPSKWGAALPEGTMLDVTGSVRPPVGDAGQLAGRIQVQSMNGPRRVLQRIDARGVRLYQDVPVGPTSKFEIDSPEIANGPSGSYVVQLTLTDLSGNSGTVTATITK